MSGKLLIEQQMIHVTNNAVLKAISEGLLPDIQLPLISVDVPKEEKFGDFSLNIAMQLAKPMQMKPRDIAQIIIEKIVSEDSMIESAEIAGPGFINIRLNPVW